MKNTEKENKLTTTEIGIREILQTAWSKGMAAITIKMGTDMKESGKMTCFMGKVSNLNTMAPITKATGQTISFMAWDS